MTLVLKSKGRDYVFDEVGLRNELRRYNNAELVQLKQRYVALHKKVRTSKPALEAMLDMLDDELATRARN